MQPPPEDRIIAARIGLSHEPTGIVLLRRVENITDTWDKRANRWHTTTRYEVPELLRIPGGSSHATIADEIADLVAEAKDDRAERVSTVVDLTAVGTPFLKLLRERGIRSAPVMIGDASTPRATGRVWAIPAREMISIALGLMADKRLEVAELEHASMLDQQLQAYATKQPPRDALSDWRPAPHTDLAHALMLSAWWGERMLRSIVHHPPAPQLPIEIRTPTMDEMVKWARRA